MEAEGKVAGAGSKAMEVVKQRQEASSGSSLLDMALSFISSWSPGRQPLKQGGTGSASSFLDDLVEEAVVDIPAWTLVDITDAGTAAGTSSSSSGGMPEGFLESFSLDDPRGWVLGLEPVNPPMDGGTGSIGGGVYGSPDSTTDGIPVKTTVDAWPEFINDIERYLLGFVTGSGGRKTAMPQSQICINSVKEGIESSFEMLRLNKPESLPSLASEYQRLTKSLNLAYAYCEFASYWAGYAHVFGDLGIDDAIRTQEELDLGDSGTDADGDGTGDGASGAADAAGDASASDGGTTTDAGTSTPVVSSSRYGEYAHFTNLTRKSIRHMLVR